MESFIYDYFIQPILARTGYNPVNTIAYAIIALASLYAIFNFFKMKRIPVDNSFVSGVLGFVLLGSTVRVVTDSIDSGVFAPITPLHSLVIQSHVYDYGFLTVTPGIYAVIAFLFLSSFFILRKLGRAGDLWKVGIALWLPHFLLLIPFAAYFPFVRLAFLLAAIPFAAAGFLLRDRDASLIVGAHALDGAATFVAIEMLPMFAPVEYFEQHVVSGFVGAVAGSYLGFYILKVLVSFAAAWVVAREKMDDDERRYISLVLVIMGLAPGLRDILRMLLGA